MLSVNFGTVIPTINKKYKTLESMCGPLRSSRHAVTRHILQLLYASNIIELLNLFSISL